MKVRVESWSHCVGEWGYHGNFDSEEEVNKYISDKGFDPKYFKIIPVESTQEDR